MPRVTSSRTAIINGAVECDYLALLIAVAVGSMTEFALDVCLDSPSLIVSLHG